MNNNRVTIEKLVPEKNKWNLGFLRIDGYGGDAFLPHVLI